MEFFETPGWQRLWLGAATLLMLAACGRAPSAVGDAQTAITPPHCAVGQTLCDCGACTPEYACYPTGVGGQQSCSSFCKSCTPVITPPPSTNVCAANCLGGSCPGVINVRRCLTAACDGTLPPASPAPDDYALLQNAAAYVNAHSVGTSATPVTMVYPGVFTVNEYSQNAFGTTVCGNGATTNCCPTAPSNLPIIFGNVAGNPDDTSKQLSHFSLVGCNDPITNAKAAINLNGNFPRHADIETDNPGQWISCNDGVIPFQIANGNDFSISGIEINGNNQLTTKPDDQGCETGTCSVYVGEGNSYGIYIQTSNLYQLVDLDIHNIGSDGLAIGEATSGDLTHGDTNVTVTNVNSHHNGRDGLSIFQVKNASFNQCSLHDNGKPCSTDAQGNVLACGNAAYSGYAGVDIEPNNAGGIVVDTLGFNNTTFENNRGADFSCVVPAAAQNVTFTGCTFEKDPDPRFPTNAAIAYLGMTKTVVQNSTFNDNTGATINLGVAYPPVCNPAGQPTVGSTLQMTNSTINATVAQSGVNLVTTSYGGLSDSGTCDNCKWPCTAPTTYAYPSVDIENSSFLANYAWPVPPPTYENSVGVMINLLGTTTFVGNTVSVSEADYPLVNAYPSGGNPVVNLAPYYQGQSGVSSYAASNTYELLAAPSPLPAGDTFEIAYGTGQVCGDQIDTGFQPTDALGNVGPKAPGWTSAPSLFSQNCPPPVTCGTVGKACCAPSGTCGSGLTCTAGVCQTAPPAACTNCTATENSCLLSCARSGGRNQAECSCLCKMNYCTCETRNNCVLSCNPNCTL